MPDSSNPAFFLIFDLTLMGAPRKKGIFVSGLLSNAGRPAMVIDAWNSGKSNTGLQKNILGLL